MAQAKRIRIGKGGRKKPTMTAKKRKTHTVKFAIYMRNNGDGSSSPIFYSTKELAEQAAEKDDERNCDDVCEETLVIDAETGEILEGVATSLPDDED